MPTFAQRYGPWALVAGASEGLGAAFAQSLAARGLNLVLLARRQALLDALGASLIGRHQVEVKTHALDLARPDLADAIAAATQGLDIGLVVFNAAYSPIGEFVSRTPEDLARIVDVNAKAPLTLARHFAPAMVARGKGGIVLMSSLAGFQGAPNIATYAGTKAFNIVLAEGLAEELKPKGVDVLACVAGAVRTPGYAKAATGDAPGTLDAMDVANAALDALGKRTIVIPGTVNRIARFALGRLMTRRAATAVMARSTRALS